MILKIVSSILILQFGAGSSIANACSSFLISGAEGPVLAKSFDWNYGHGMLTLNPRGLSKDSIISPPNKPMSWTSKYGSITFNQVARELPFEGMNEAGLAVQALWLGSAKFAEANNSPTLNESQFIQYVLDSFSTVDELLKKIDSIHVINRIAAIHYFACDAKSQCAVIEPINGKWVVHAGDNLKVSLITNDTYDDSVKFAEKYLTAKSLKEIPSDGKSLNRYARLNYLLNQNGKDSKNTVSEASNLLKNVYRDKDDSNDFETQWDTIYELKAKRITFMPRDTNKKKVIDLSKLNFECGHGSQILNLESSENGNVTSKFEPYSERENLVIVQKSLKSGFAHLLDEAIQRTAKYPDSFSCAGK